jgi:serine/threonine-protein kinase
MAAMTEGLNSIEPGDRIGPYRIVRGFKRGGGMARVFEAEVREKYRIPGTPTRVALKVAKEEYQSALVMETDFLSRFDHPNVVRIFPLAGYHRPVYAARSQFRFGWGWYYAMELVSGDSLERRLTRPATVTNLLRPPPDGERRLCVLEALGIARQLALALQHIHEKNVINLDVKPGNVLIRRRRLRYLRGSVPGVVLCDFGISRDLRYSRAGMLGVATPEYVSPEQVTEGDRGQRPLDARSDVFSLGIVTYEMLTGALPFESVALVRDPNHTPPPLRQLCPSVPRQLEEIVTRALARDPAQRYQTAAEMYDALHRVRAPFDWRAAARRTFFFGSAALTLTACVLGGRWGAATIPEMLRTPAPPVPAVSTPTPIPVGTSPPTSTPTSRPRVTSTRAPTSTPTRTPVPTLTPTPGGG